MQKKGFVCFRTDKVRDRIDSMFREVCQDVISEPVLLNLDSEQFSYRRVNTSHEKQVDVCAH